MIIKRISIATVALLSSLTVAAATYYVSPNGNDNNLGTSQAAPWRTISKVNSRTYSPGDQVLFERGSVYRGSVAINQSGTAGNPITISAYGSGSKPTLLGSIQPTNWTIHSGNIWKTQVSSKVFNLYCNGGYMPLARYPNVGWLTNDNGTASQINDAQLTQPSGYWNGATVVVRTSAWSYDTSYVTSYVSGVLNFTQFSYGYNLQDGLWGYFIRNKFSELDAPGEWFYDTSTQTLYFFPPSGVDPNAASIEAVTNVSQTSGSGVRTSWQRDYVTISNLAFKYYGWAGVNTSGAEFITINGCDFDFCARAISAYGYNHTITNNTITNTLQTSIFVIAGPDGGDNNLIEGNQLTNCAMYPGEGESSWGYFGMRITGNNNTIRGNRLNNIGYIGIVGAGNGVLAEKNFITNCCSILNDGAGIGFDDTNSCIIQDNIILNTIGSVESAASNINASEPKGKGIYFGNINNQNTIVRRNTIAYCKGPGIWVDNTMSSANNQIVDNVCFNNQLYQIGFSDFSNYSGPAAVAPYAVAQYSHTIQGNTFYCLDPSQMSMYHINRWFTGIDFGDFSNNKYVNPWNPNNIRIWSVLTSSLNNYNLSQWQAIRGDDLNSTAGSFQPSTAGSASNHILVYNDAYQTASVALPSGTWKDLDGNSYAGSITLNSFASKVLREDLLVGAATPSTNNSLLVQAEVLYTPPGIQLVWSSFTSATGYVVHRKLKSATSWGNPIATLGGTATQYLDLAVSLNTYYEYRITRNSSAGVAYGYVASGLRIDPVEYRGRMVLVVDNTFTSSLATQLAQLQEDLKKDGWNVTRIDVSRTATPASVRSQIQTIYNADPTNVKSVLLFGHVPVYRSGNIAPDGHTAIPWACDAYYGEMNSSWSTPPTSLPSDVELEVGRIDLFNLPAFGLSEQQLLSNYLTKLSQFKTRQYVVQPRMLMQDNLNWVNNPLAETGYRTAGPLVGINGLTDLPSYTSPNFVSRMSDNWLWGYFSGGGSYNSADGIGTTSNFVSTQNNVVFNMSMGSYFGNWDCSSGVPNWNNNNDNLLRAVIANGRALTSVYAGQPNWFFHHMGLGDPIGFSTKTSMNNRTSTAVYQPQNGGWLGQGYTTVHLGLMGDPSLRMNYVAPPTNLTVTQNGSNLTFNWTASNQTVDGYYLYQIVGGVPTRVFPTVITATTITGAFTTAPGTEYMVRAVKLETTASGSYNNLSLGALVTVPQPSTCTIAAKVFLQGPFSGTLMGDNLRSAGLIPLSDPYPSLGYSHVGSGGAATTPAVLAVTGNDAIVDWVVVEIRSATVPSQRLYTAAALLQRDGDVVSTDGVSPLSIPLAPGQYHVAVRHRNHLGAMTGSPISLTSGSTLDFNSVQTWGTGAMTMVGSTKALWAGDVTFDGLLKYTGTGNDRDPILSRIGGVIPTNVVSGYYQEDVNLSGVTAYTGTNNDRDIILLNIGGVTPTNTKTQQIP